MQEGGSQQYGVPSSEMTPFAASVAGTRAQVLGVSGSDHLHQQQHAPAAEAASPISSRPPMDELTPAAAQGGFPDEDAVLAAAAGEEGERGGATGNRWPREETLALLRIRSEMDAVFRDATLKGPLWEDVSRKLAELGYKRSAKKCKEKFENVHKYYKRTKDGRAGRQDGKSYRFFSQLEALHSSGGGGGATTCAAAIPISSAPAASNTMPSSIAMVGSAGRLQPTPLNAIPLSVSTAPHVVPEPLATTTTTPAAGVSYPSGRVSFSSNNSSSASESEEEDTEEGLPEETRKRKRRGGGGGSRKMMAFFDGLMKQVMERQEAMQQRFLEMIEKREQDRMIREEAWRRQEMARLSREHEMMAQEREISASRDAAIITFLQKMTGQPLTVPPAMPASAAMPAQPLSHQQPPPAPPPASATPPPHHPQPPQGTEVATSSLEVVPFMEAQEAAGGASGSTDPASSRWPKSEVHALIKMRSGMESKYQEAGPKGPLWEEIAAGMRRLGYNRSAKRCKEKWENINKYYKKVKDSNKKRPEDAKTCPYFHQLEALYRKKSLIGDSAAATAMGNHTKPEQEPSPSPASTSQDVAAAVAPQPVLPHQPQSDAEGKNNGGGGGNNGNRNGDGNGVREHTQSFFDEVAGSDGSVKKPEDIVKELMDQQQREAAMDDYDKMEETDSDSMGQEEDDDDDDEEEDEKRKMAYHIEYQQRPSVNGTSNGGGNPSAAAAAAAAATGAGPFMAMVQ